MKRLRFLNEIALVVSIFSALTACTNISSSKNRAPTSNVSLSDPYTSSDSSAFVLKTVAADLVSPGTVYDMVGSNEQFDTYCGGTLGTCMCEYSYVQPGVGTQTTSAAVLYQESDLIKCPNAVPSGITTFDVRIVVVPAGTGTGTSTTTSASTISYASNSSTVNLSTSGAFAGSTSYIDLTNASSYVPVQRFQCRKREFITNPLDGEMIDPFQSGDPAVIYPFNYYTTNVSVSLLRMQQLGNQSWECTLTATQDRSLQWWANPNVFSAASCTGTFCAGDQELMYPQKTINSGSIPLTNPAATGKRRSSFSLSATAYGVFQIAVQAAVAPIDSLTSTYSVVGYGAKPIPNVSGVSSCPSIAIPAKASWVKLWHFRSTNIRSPRKVTTSSSIASLSGIACNTQSGVFPSCDKGGAIGTQTLSTATTNTPAARIALLSQSGDTAPNACYEPSSFLTAANSSEIWTPSNYGFTVTSGNYDIDTGTFGGFPLNVYNPISTWNRCKSSTVDSWISTGACPAAAATNSSAFAAAPLPAATPGDALRDADSTPLSTENYNDQLFVVTDPGVNDNTMTYQTDSYPEYKPVTYRSYSDCPGPSKGGCTAGAIDWQAIAKEVGNESNSTDIYPLCVLQFYD